MRYSVNGFFQITYNPHLTCREIMRRAGYDAATHYIYDPSKGYSMMPEALIHLRDNMLVLVREKEK